MIFFLNFSVRALQRGGKVIFPVHPCGIVYDLFHIIHDTLQKNGLFDIPMHFISPAAKKSLHYANIMGEWSVHSLKILYFLLF